MRIAWKSHVPPSFQGGIWPPSISLLKILLTTSWASFSLPRNTREEVRSFSWTLVLFPKQPASFWREESKVGYLFHNQTPRVVSGTQLARFSSTHRRQVRGEGGWKKSSKNLHSVLLRSTRKNLKIDAREREKNKTSQTNFSLSLSSLIYYHVSGKVSLRDLNHDLDHSPDLIDSFFDIWK